MRVDTEGLERWAAQCATAAAELVARAPVAAGLPSGQATAAAVAASQPVTSTAAEVLAARMQATATKATIAAGGYEASEVQSAHRLSALAGESAVVS